MVNMPKNQSLRNLHELHMPFWFYYGHKIDNFLAAVRSVNPSVHSNGSLLVKVTKSRKQFTVSWFLPKNEQKITILSIFSLENTQDSDFLFVFGRIKEKIICSQDCLTCSLLNLSYLILIDLAKKNNQNFYGAFAHCFESRKNFFASIALYYIVCDSVKALCLG